MPPSLTFACELPAGPLSRLFADGSVARELERLGASVSLGLVDLSDERARAVRGLKARGIPVRAWLLLDRADGYWCHAGNAAAALARYEALQSWSRANGLAWAGLDVDLEPAWDEMNHAAAGRWGRALRAAWRRGFSKSRLERARREYAALFARVRAAGLVVSTYVMPPMLDDRRAGASLVQRAFGVPLLAGDREIAMLYSSVFGRFGPAVLASYGPECGAIAVGSTGGGVVFDGSGELRALAWDELARDLRLAASFARDVTVFSLEGCVERGWLPRIAGLDWTPPRAPPSRAVSLVRGALGAVLRVASGL